MLYLVFQLHGVSTPHCVVQGLSVLWFFYLVSGLLLELIISKYQRWLWIYNENICWLKDICKSQNDFDFSPFYICEIHIFTFKNFLKKNFFKICLLIKLYKHHVICLGSPSFYRQTGQTMDKVDFLLAYYS